MLIHVFVFALCFRKWLSSISFFLILSCSVPLAKERKAWGIYQIHWGDSPLSWLKKAESEFETLQVVPDYLMIFRDLEFGFPSETLSLVGENYPDIQFVLSLEITRWARPKAVPYLKLVAEGHFDDYFKQWAEAARVYGKVFYLRFGFEMNGDWFEWGMQPDIFKKAWHRVHRIFSEAGAKNVKWIFSPNVLWGDKTFAKDVEPYYPGEEWVDVVGLDGYNFGDHHDIYHHWQSYDEVFEKSIEALGAFSKPLWITEISSAPGSAKAAWVSDFLQKFKTDSRLKAFIWFQYDKREEREPDWRIQSDSQSLKVFRKEWSAYLKSTSHKKF